MSGYPRINLCIDNCFASKRWTRPGEWMEIAKELGVDYVEASADTEADPLYCGEEYLTDWIDAVAKAEVSTGAKVANLYSGHGTYSTLGLGHTDARVRRRILESWVKPMLRAARQLRAGLGFYCHAFPHSVLQDPADYAGKVDELTGELSEIAGYALDLEGVTVSLEQMYSPHQIPWTISGTRQLLASIHQRSRASLYVTIDTGHQIGQSRYVRPSVSLIKKVLRRPSSRESLQAVWLGPEAAFELAENLSTGRRAAGQEEMLRLASVMDRFPYLFSRAEDSDTYRWFRSLGCYSPIVHLQQVTGESSVHLPFTPDTNKMGIIHAPKLLSALADAYREPPDDGMPPRVNVIYLTLEIFSGTSQRPREIVANLKESVAYWRTYVPHDGLRLDALVERDG